MYYSLNLTTGGSAKEIIDLAQAAESAGFQRVWAQDRERCAFTSTALLAGRCERIGLGTGIARAFTRSPMETALAALDLQRDSAGRFVLGLGAGTRLSIEKEHGMPFDSPAARMRDYVEIVRQLLTALPAGKSIKHAGPFYHVTVDAKETRSMSDVPPPPIYLGTQGLLMAQVAGEVCDGILGHVLGTPEWLRERILPAVHRGFAASTRSTGTFEVTGTLVCAISSDRATARRQVLGVLAHYAAEPSNFRSLAWHGFEQAAHHLSSMPLDEAALHVPDEMIGCFAAIGSSDDVRRAANRFQGIASSVRLIPPPYVLTAEETAAYQQAILETFGQAGIR